MAQQQQNIPNQIVVQGAEEVADDFCLSGERVTVGCQWDPMFDESKEK